ncbi:MAG: lipoyl(octanoyl) transferase LipB [Gammaproteobacteria bacterium]|nr:lipoyl(octanoyl) transferase LipB [Pseudomonadales bacterium]MCP5345637.1 lipoyl(octanoyl) transferase LipB [Pseudomonadales bacterium]
MITVRRLGLQDYLPIWKVMRYIADHPERRRGDELWLLSHKPVFTLGQAGRQEHLLNPGVIPVIQTDRGGQVTYHGPGQLVIYLLLDLRKRKMGARDLVTLIESAIVELLQDAGINGAARPEAPGVYVEDAKIAALGLRIRKGRSYHGLSLNVDMDLEPFTRINPCGYQGLQVTQLADLVPDRDRLMQRTAVQLANKLAARLGHEQIDHQNTPPGIV